MADQRALVRNGADDRQVQDGGRREKSIRERELEDVRAILASPQGRRFMWRYLAICGVFRSSWTPSAEIHFNEGRRDIGLHLLADVNDADPEAYVRMMQEAKRDQENV